MPHTCQDASEETVAISNTLVLACWIAGFLSPAGGGEKCQSSARLPTSFSVTCDRAVTSPEMCASRSDCSVTSSILLALMLGCSGVGKSGKKALEEEEEDG